MRMDPTTRAGRGAQVKAGLIYVDMSMSLDGFVAGPGVSVDNPMGDGGDRLHDWMFADRSSEASRAFEDQRFATTGALIMGRTMFDVGVSPWGDDPVFHAPVFVVTHRAADPIRKRGGTTYTFVTEGTQAALQQARAAAGHQEICVAGGAQIIQHYQNHGLVAEVRLHVVPIFLGAGVRLFAIDRPTTLALQTPVAEDNGVVHLTYHRTEAPGRAHEIPAR